MLARAGVTGPPTVFEGRFGLFASHLQDAEAPKDFGRVTARLGTLWESRNASFKPYPAAHVLHPYVDAILLARERHGFSHADVVRVECPVAEFNVGIVCEPVAEKVAPASDSHARISLQHTIAEALYFGRLGKTAYREESRRNPEILALARRVGYHIDPSFPAPGRFKGAVHVTLSDGRVISETQEHNLGSPENPMSPSQLRQKFDENAAGILTPPERDRLAAEINRLDELDDASAIVERSIPSVLSGSMS
jgi:2-methylcitrate dehydratase PrpD